MSIAIKKYLCPQKQGAEVHMNLLDILGASVDPDGLNEIWSDKDLRGSLSHSSPCLSLCLSLS